VLALVIASLRFYQLGRWSFWYDEAMTVTDAAHGVESGDLHNPLGYRLLRAIAAWLGPEREIGWRFLPALAGVALVPAAFLALRSLSQPLVAAGGALVLQAIDGIASEGALMGWFGDERFLWASDYIQNVRASSQYAREVLRATRRVGIVPERFAAEHVRLTPWRTIDSLLADEPPAAASDVPDAARLSLEQAGPLPAGVALCPCECAVIQAACEATCGRPSAFRCDPNPARGCSASCSCQ